MEKLPLSLAGVHLLITRPEPQAQTLCEKIKRLGGDAVVLPTIEIVAVADKTQVQLQIQQLAEQDIAIFISLNAVNCSVPLIREYWQQWPANTKIAAIGSTTAQALHLQHWPVDICPSEQFNSEGLLALPALQNIKGKKIIIFRGEGGREWLAIVLRLRGAEITEVITYQRKLPKVATGLRGKIGNVDIILCASNTSLENLFIMMGEPDRVWLQNRQLLVISTQMAAFASTLGFVKSPLIADNATDDAVIKLLISWREQHNGNNNINSAPNG